eukprot:INCI1342.2.p1 GENE.INCI1342.2~~INCI1342.2.p1  ORF type:complete len:458 (+),score=64.66 INCI1342.2:103-1476(+)
MSAHSSNLKLRTPPPPPQGPPPPGAQRGSPDTVGSFGSFDDDERTPSPPPSSFARQHARPAPAPPPSAIRAGQQGGAGGRYFQGKLSTSQPPPPPDHPPRFTPRARGSPTSDRSRSPVAGRLRSVSPGLSLAADFSASAGPHSSMSPRSRRSSGRSAGSASSRAVGSAPPGIFDTSPRGSPRVSPRMSPRTSFADRSVAEDFEIDFFAAEAALADVPHTHVEDFPNPDEETSAQEAVRFARQAGVHAKPSRRVDQQRSNPSSRVGSPTSASSIASAGDAQRTLSRTSSLALLVSEAKRRLSTEVATLSAGELAAVDLVERLEKAHSQAELTESHATLLAQLQNEIRTLTDKQAGFKSALEAEQNKHTEALRALHEDFLRLQELEESDDSKLLAELADVDEAIRSTSMILDDAIRADCEAEGKEDDAGGAWNQRVSAHFAAQDRRVADTITKIYGNSK